MCCGFSCAVYFLYIYCTYVLILWFFFGAWRLWLLNGKISVRISSYVPDFVFQCIAHQVEEIMIELNTKPFVWLIQGDYLWFLLISDHTWCYLLTIRVFYWCSKGVLSVRSLWRPFLMRFPTCEILRSPSVTSDPSVNRTTQSTGPVSARQPCWC